MGSELPMGRRHLDMLLTSREAASLRRDLLLPTSYLPLPTVFHSPDAAPIAGRRFFKFRRITER